MPREASNQHRKSILPLSFSRNTNCKWSIIFIKLNRHNLFLNLILSETKLSIFSFTSGLGSAQSRNHQAIIVRFIFDTLFPSPVCLLSLSLRVSLYLTLHLFHYFYLIADLGARHDKRRLCVCARASPLLQSTRGQLLREFLILITSK